MIDSSSAFEKQRQNQKKKKKQISKEKILFYQRFLWQRIDSTIFVSTMVQGREKKVFHINYTKKYSAQGISPNQFSLTAETNTEKPWGKKQKKCQCAGGFRSIDVTNCLLIMSMNRRCSPWTTWNQDAICGRLMAFSPLMWHHAKVLFLGGSAIKRREVELDHCSFLSLSNFYSQK